MDVYLKTCLLVDIRFLLLGYYESCCSQHLCSVYMCVRGSACAQPLVYVLCVRFPVSCICISTYHWSLFSFWCLNWVKMITQCVMYICANCMSGAHRGQKRTLASLDLKLQVVVSHQMGAGIEPGSSGRTAITLNHWAFFFFPILNHIWSDTFLQK